MAVLWLVYYLLVKLREALTAYLQVCLDQEKLLLSVFRASWNVKTFRVVQLIPSLRRYNFFEVCSGAQRAWASAHTG